MDIPIVYEDDTLLLVNKPAGVVVNRAESVKGETVTDWAEHKFHVSGITYQDDAKDFVDRAGIVHRIDKETSGCLLIAKTPEAFFDLQRQFKERLVSKTYLALVHGTPVPPEGDIDAPVGRLPWNRERFGIFPGGKEAQTRYAVRETKGDISLVELFPKTGRTHQLRVHLKYVNHPIVGDALYAGRKVSRRDRKDGFARVMLHAWKLTCTHPASGATLDFESAIPDDMERWIRTA